MHNRPILIVHPNDKTTSFLNKIKNHIVSSFKEQVHHYNVYPNEDSHNNCLNRISNHPKEGLIIFLGHGRTDRLYGSKGNLFGEIDFASSDAIDENPELFYYNDNFINESNINVFEGKKVFCLACNSNNRIAQFAIENGATSFLGFGDIPTSKNEFEEKKEIVSKNFIKRMKAELNYIVKTCLAIGLRKGLTFEELLNYIQFLTNQRLANIIMNEKHFKERYLLADYLYYFKKEAVVLGAKKSKLIG